MAGMLDDVAETPEQTARRAGFPMTPIPGYYTPPAGAPQATGPLAPPALPRSVLAPAATPMKAGPSAGTTELIPGAMDWIRTLAADMLPSRSAVASPPGAGLVPPVAPTGLARLNPVNTSLVGPPAPRPSFFSRFIRGFTPGTGAPSSGGVEG